MEKVKKNTKQLLSLLAVLAVFCYGSGTWDKNKCSKKFYSNL